MVREPPVTTHYVMANKQSEKLNQCVEKVLNQILGKEATEIIYEYLENNHSIHRHEIAEKLDSFNGALEAYLGTGASVIEKVILENFEENRNTDFDERHRLLKMA